MNYQIDNIVLQTNRRYAAQVLWGYAYLQTNRHYVAQVLGVAAFLQRNRRYAALGSCGCLFSTNKSPQSGS